jgi:hypothetical protein
LQRTNAILACQLKPKGAAQRQREDAAAKGVAAIRILGAVFAVIPD